MAMRAVHRAALARLRSGGITSAHTQSRMWLCTSRLLTSSVQPVVSEESENGERRPARECAPSVFEHSIGKDIAALEVHKALAPVFHCLAAHIGRSLTDRC